MKTIALAQAYNESYFVNEALDWIYPLVDGIVITEGALTPFGNMPAESPDGTRKMISDWISANDIDNKCLLILDNGPQFDILKGKTREAREGINKNCMLSVAIERFGLEDGDVMFVLDFDEFFIPEKFQMHVDLMKKNTDWTFIRSEEWQFAYGMKYAFPGSHGRFYRYKWGSKFGNTNHFFYPNGTNIIRKPSFVVPRGDSGFFHLCWVKHPELIKEKVISFNRPSFTTWFNYVYLVWPIDQKQAYSNNAQIQPYCGTGFAEGQHEKLVEFTENIPQATKSFNVDWTKYINQHYEDLLIK